jgi:hypothetical protein
MPHVIAMRLAILTLPLQKICMLSTAARRVKQFMLQAC